MNSLAYLTGLYRDRPPSRTPSTSRPSRPRPRSRSTSAVVSPLASSSSTDGLAAAEGAGAVGRRRSIPEVHVRQPTSDLEPDWPSSADRGLGLTGLRRSGSSPVLGETAAKQDAAAAVAVGIEDRIEAEEMSRSLTQPELALSLGSLDMPRGRQLVPLTSTSTEGRISTAPISDAAVPEPRAVPARHAAAQSGADSPRTSSGSDEVDADRVQGVNEDRLGATERAAEADLSPPPPPHPSSSRLAPTSTPPYYPSLLLQPSSRSSSMSSSSSTSSISSSSTDVPSRDHGIDQELPPDYASDTSSSPSLKPSALPRHTPPISPAASTSSSSTTTTSPRRRKKATPAPPPPEPIPDSVAARPRRTRSLSTLVAHAQSTPVRLAAHIFVLLRRFFALIGFNVNLPLDSSPQKVITSPAAETPPPQQERDRRGLVQWFGDRRPIRGRFSPFGGGRRSSTDSVSKGSRGGKTTPTGSWSRRTARDELGSGVGADGAMDGEDEEKLRFGSLFKSSTSRPRLGRGSGSGSTTAIVPIGGGSYQGSRAALPAVWEKQVRPDEKQELKEEEPAKLDEKNSPHRFSLFRRSLPTSSPSTPIFGTPVPSVPSTPSHQPTTRLTSQPTSSGVISFINDKTLVLDLDETLIHSTSRVGGLAGTQGSSGMAGGGLGGGAGGVSGLKWRVVEVVLDGRSVVYYVYKRPWVDFFLRKVASWYTVVIFTASMQEYADPVIDWLDQGKGIIHGRFFRESCMYVNGQYVKDLSVLKEDLAKVCLVDNSPMSYAMNPANGVPIEGFISDPNDEALLDLLPMLDGLRLTNDVRHILGLRGFGTATVPLGKVAPGGKAVAINRKR